MKLKDTKKETLKNYILNNYISNSIILESSNLYCYYINNKRVVKNYNTIIAIIDTKKNYNKIYINNNYYSKTTKENTNLLKYYATIENMIIKEVEEKAIYKMLENE